MPAMHGSGNYRIVEYGDAEKCVSFGEDRLSTNQTSEQRAGQPAFHAAVQSVGQSVEQPAGQPDGQTAGCCARVGALISCLAVWAASLSGE